MDEQHKFLKYPIKLWISDILKAPPHPMIPSAFIFSGIAFKTVNILGSVVSIQNFKKFTVYVVDDSTGQIECSIDNNDDHENVKLEKAFKLQDALASSNDFIEEERTVLNELCSKMIKCYQEERDIKLGCTIQVTGKLNISKFCERRIYCNSLKLVHDLVCEGDRILEMTNLYKIYESF